MHEPSCRERVFAYFKQRYGLTDAELASDIPLAEFMDSLGRLALISFIRGDLGAALEAADVNPENLGSPERIVAYVDRSRSGGR
jgi:hypothetical protein